MLASKNDASSMEYELIYLMHNRQSIAVGF